MFFMGHSVDQIDMVINERKSCCMRIGPRYNIACAPYLLVQVSQLHGQITYVILVLRLCDLALSNALSIMIKSPSIVLQTPYLEKLGELHQRRLFCN